MILGCANEMIGLALPAGAFPMNSASTTERGFVQPDSAAFVADHDLLRVLVARSTPVECASDRVLFNQEETAAGIYILLEGTGTLTMKSHDGRTIFSIRALPGSLLGLRR